MKKKVNKKEKEDKMSRKKFLIIICSFYVVFYVVCKLFLLLALDVYTNNELLETKYFDAETITLNFKESTDKEMMVDDFAINTIKIDGFEEVNLIEEDNYKSYEFLYETGEEENAFLYLGKNDNLITKINDYDETSIFYSLNHFPVYISDMAKKSYFKKHDIKDEVDLVKYIRTRDKKTSNFFTSLYTIKERYFFYLIENNLPNINSSFKFIDGTYKGYVYKTYNMLYYVFDIGNGEIRFLTLYNLNYFDDNKVNEILENLIIK